MYVVTFLEICWNSYADCWCNASFRKSRKEKKRERKKEERAQAKALSYTNGSIDFPWTWKKFEACEFKGELAIGEM